MRHRWAPAFTIIELMIVVIVLGILVTVAAISYSGFREKALATAAQNDLNTVVSVMERELQKTKTYPATLPTDVQVSDNVTLTLVETGETPYYTNLTGVQNGVLFSEVCADLISENKGKGTNQGGGTENYITGCDQWNHGSMQITGWQTRTWTTPVQKQALLDYGNNFTTGDSWNIDQVRVIREFYTLLVSRFEQQGGTFPITTFWDYWADPGNGGVMKQQLDTNPLVKRYYCAEATIEGSDGLIWHVTQKKEIEEGGC